MSALRTERDGGVLRVTLAKPEDLKVFLKGVPKRGDLHNHLTGAVYAETFLAWGKTDGDCINSTTFAAV